MRTSLILRVVLVAIVAILLVVVLWYAGVLMRMLGSDSHSWQPPSRTDQKELEEFAAKRQELQESGFFDDGLRDPDGPPPTLNNIE